MRNDLLWVTLGFFTWQNLGPTKPSKEILGSSCNSCHSCFHVVGHIYWQFDAIWCRCQEKPSTGNQWPLSSVIDTQEVQIDKNSYLCIGWGGHKSQQNTGSTLLKLQRHLLSYVVKTAYFKRQYLCGPFYKTGLHFPPFLFVFPLGALSTEYWAKFIRKSSIGSWIKFDFLCIFLQVTSVWCPYSQSWDNTHFVMDYNMTGILTET